MRQNKKKSYAEIKLGIVIICDTFGIAALIYLSILINLYSEDNLYYHQAALE